MTDEIVKGFKATDKNMQCRGFQFELGVWHKHNGEIAMCESGFHFCEYPSGPWSFYRDDGTRIFKVEARGVIRGEGPGADLKHVAMEICLVEEVSFDGDRNTGGWNTGDGNTGDRNTGGWNTGDRNTGDGNTGGWNTGDRNTGGWNTGDGNTGNRNTGDRNTGNRNTGDGNTGGWNTGDRNTGNRNTGGWNTGDWNTGDGNATDKCSGYLCCKEQPVIIFDKKVKAGFDVNWPLVHRLSGLMMSDDPIDCSKFLSIPNASETAIKKLHKAHIDRRKAIK